MGSREQLCPNMGICDVNEVTWSKYSILIGRDNFLLRSDWLVLIGALSTTLHYGGAFGLNPAHIHTTVVNVASNCS